MIDGYWLHYVTHALPLEMGARIRATRKAAGWTQAALAEAIGRRQASLCEIEQGKMMIDAVTLAKLSLVLHKSPAYFYPPLFLRLHRE